MRSRILFLGTGGDISLTGRSIRSSGGIIIQTQNCQFHIDPGIGAVLKAAQYGVDIREHTAVLVSHAHTNHAGEIGSLLCALSHNGLDPHGVVIASRSVCQGLHDNIPRLTPFYKSCVEKVIMSEAGNRVGIEDVEIVALATHHTDASAVGFRITTPEFVVSYTSDTAFDKDLAQNYKGSNILILNTLYPFENEAQEGLSSKDVVKILKATMPNLAIITHFGSKMLQANPLYESREIQKQTGVQVVAAEDGLCVDPVSYAAELRQTTLSMFKAVEKDQVQSTRLPEEKG
ncbi:MAG: hypothetical protein HY363_01005 [Candidatus Aenigmarchaeota archaeon]|nr:hypothetical protein [Candidatus Aenigmarchaeota archaeon]